MKRLALLAIAALLTSACVSVHHELPATSLDKRLRHARVHVRPAPAPAAKSARPPPLPTSPRARVPTTPVVEGRLANGARVLVSERRDFPSVAIMFVLDRGSCDDPAAAMVYGGAIQGDSSEHDDNLSYLYYIAALYGTRTYDDAMVFHAEVLPPLVTSAVSRLASMFFAPGLTAHDIERSRDHIGDSLARAGTREKRVATRTVRQLLFGPSGHGRVLVDKSEIELTSDSAVRAFRAASLSPQHVTVIGVGDVKADAFVTMLETYTKDLPRRNEVRPSTCGAIAPPAIAREIHVVDDPGAAQSQIAIGAVGVPAGHADAPALDVLSAAMGASLSSRLSLFVREEHGWSYGVTMSSQEWRAQGLVHVATSVETGRTADALGGLLRELDRAADDPLDAGELKRAKVATDVRGGTHADEASDLLDVAAYGLPADATAKRRHVIEGIGADEVRRVAARYLAKDKRAIVVVGDAAKIEPSLRALGLGDVVVEPRPH